MKQGLDALLAFFPAESDLAIEAAAELAQLRAKLAVIEERERWHTDGSFPDTTRDVLLLLASGYIGVAHSHSDDWSGWPTADVVAWREMPAKPEVNHG